MSIFRLCPKTLIVQDKNVKIQIYLYILTIHYRSFWYNLPKIVKFFILIYFDFLIFDFNVLILYLTLITTIPPFSLSPPKKSNIAHLDFKENQIWSPSPVTFGKRSRKKKRIYFKFWHKYIFEFWHKYFFSILTRIYRLNSILFSAFPLTHLLHVC